MCEDLVVEDFALDLKVSATEKFSTGEMLCVLWSVESAVYEDMFTAWHWVICHFLTIVCERSVVWRGELSTGAFGNFCASLVRGLMCFLGCYFGSWVGPFLVHYIAQ